MKIGVKTFDNPKFLDHFKDSCDFYEIMILENKDYDFVKDLDKPVVIHSQHKVFGINNADKLNFEKNLSSINYAIKFADMCNAKKIIMHPGEIVNDNCSLDNSISFVKSLNDRRILIENMPFTKNMPRLCKTKEEIEIYMKKAKVGFCLDFNHAIEFAVPTGLPYVPFIKSLLELKPKHFHLGGHITKTNTTHLSLSKSDIDLKELISLFPKDAEITLETEPDIKKTEEDLRIFRKYSI